jgi:hypothetical protein
MKILFVMRHAGYVRNFEAVLRSLAERGHQIHFALELERPHDVPEVADRLVSEYAGITYGGAPVRTDIWFELAHRVRHAIDYLRYLAPVYHDAPKLRARGEKHTPPWIVRWTRRPVFRSRPVVALIAWIAKVIDRAIPTAHNIDEYVGRREPDVVMVTPLLAGPTQEEFIRSAKALGCRTALPVHSWDNLTNKGLIRDVPDRIYVWNETQRREAVELHGVDPERVAVVGAHTYDHWFRWGPTATREEFCERVGIDPQRKLFLYLCSSGFICPDERPIVERWLEELRRHPDPELREAGVIVRPHPSTGHMWAEETPVDRFENAVVFPRTGADPRNKSNRDDYYDSFYHSAGVVGINTSALIEAAIVGRRSFGFRLPELFAGQEGTLHFHYLRDENGGPLSLADSLEEHFEKLGRAVRNGDSPGWNRAFLESFLRPHGLDVDAAPLFVEDLERLAASPAPAKRAPRRRLLTSLLRPLARRIHAKDPGRLRQKTLASRFGDLRAENLAEKERMRTTKQALKAEREAKRAAVVARRVAEHEEHRHRKEAEKAAAREAKALEREEHRRRETAAEAKVGAAQEHDGRDGRADAMLPAAMAKKRKKARFAHRIRRRSRRLAYWIVQHTLPRPARAALRRTLFPRRGEPATPHPGDPPGSASGKDAEREHTGSKV